MKTTTKALILAGSIGALIGSVHADPLNPTKLYITGSTAYRGVTHTAIGNILNAGFTVGFSSSTLSASGKAVFTGTLASNSEDVVIKTNWTGSVGGVQIVAGGLNTPTNFLADGLSGASQTSLEGSAHGADVAMSDTYQSATPFTTPALYDKVVGVVGFKWVASKDAALSYPNLNNITPQLAQVLFGNGSTKLSTFTGDAADSSKFVFAIGRDPDSGTRLTAFAEGGVGVAATVVQYQPTIASGAVTSHIPWPVSTVNGITFDEGNGGYSSGGTLAGVMGNTTLANLNGVYVTYLSTGDAATAVTAGAKEINYNGVTYSTAQVQEGKYTFWSYEHLMYQTGLSGVKKTTADNIATNLHDVSASILLSGMHVHRSADGGNVTPGPLPE